MNIHDYVYYFGVVVMVLLFSSTVALLLIFAGYAWQSALMGVYMNVKTTYRYLLWKRFEAIVKKRGKR